MDSINYHQIFILLLQAAIVAGLILTLFRIRTIFGLGPLFTALGVFQFIQVFLTSSFYFEVANGIFVSPGNIIFTGGLFAILLIYVREDALEARKVIYAILAANLVMSFMLIVISWGIDLEGVKNIYNFPKEFFTQDSMITIVGTLALLIDVFVIVFLYETVSKYVSQLFLRFFFSMLLVLTLDTLLFSFGIFIGTGSFPETFYDSIISKYSSVLVFSLIFSFYLQHYEKLIRRSESKVDSFKDIFYKLTFRQKYQQVSSKNVQLYEQLKENEIQFQSIFEQARDGIVIFSKDRKLLLANAELINRSGYSKVEFLSLKLSDIFKEASLEESKERIKDLIRDEIVPSFEAHLLTKKGQLIPVEISVSMLKNLYGFEVVFQGIVRDITERKQTEEALKKSEENLRLSTELANVAVWEYNFNTDSMSRSKNHDQLYGLPLQEKWKMDTFLDATHPLDREISSGFIQKSVASGGPDKYSFDFRVVYPNKTIHWLNVIGQVVERNSKGEGVIVRGTLMDITERKNLTEAIKRNERVLQLFVKHSPAAIAMFDKEMKYIVASDRFKLDYRLGETAITGRSHYEIFPEMTAEYKEIHQRCLAGEIIKNEEDSFLRADGTLDWVRWEIHPWYDQLDKIGGIIFFSEVITERKQAEEALKENYALLRIAGETAKLGGWNVNLKENRTYWSDQVAAIHEMPAGYTPLVEEGILFYAPEWRNKITEVFTNCAQNGISYDEEMEIITSKGNRVWVRTIGEAVRDNRGKIVKVQGAFQDISERKHSELLRNSEKYLLEIITQNTPFSKILEKIVLTVEALSEKTTIASILLLDDDGIHVHYGAAPHLPEAYNNALEGAPIGPNAGSCGTAAYRKEVVIVTDIEVDPLWDDYRELARAYGLRACWSTPIINSEGKVLGTFAMYYREPRTPKEEDFVLLERATHLAKIAIERNLKEQELEKSQRLLLESQRIGKVGGWEFNIDTMKQTWTEEVYRIHEVEDDYKPTVETGFNYYTPESRPVIEKAVQRAIEFGEPFDLELEIITAKGNFRSVKTIGEADLEHRRIFGFFQDITERKLAEEELHESEEKFRTLIMASSDSVYRMSPDWSVMYELDGRGFIVNTAKPNAAWFQEYIPPDDQVYVMAVIQEAIRTKSLFELEHRVWRIDGSFGWTFSRAIPRLDANGEIFEWFGAASDVTDRKQAEEKLKETFTLLHIAGETAKFGGWNVNLKENRTYWSDQVAAIHEMPVGYTPLVEEGILFYAPECRNKITEVFANCVQNGISYDEEMEIITSKGNRVWVRTIGEAVRDNKGKIVKVQGAFQDITVRKQAEIEIQAKHKLVVKTLESMSDAFVSLDKNWCYTYMNEKAGKIFNRDPKEMIGKNIWTEFPEGVGQPFQKNYEKAMSEKVFIQLEEYYEPYNLWFENRINPTEDGIAIFFQDITERKQAEENLRLSNQTIKNILDFSPAFIYIFNLNGKFLLVNKKFEKLLGTSQEELLGQTREKYFPKEIAEQHRNNDLQVINSKQTLFFEEENMEADGNHFYLTSKFPLFDAKGEIYAIGGISTDITNRKNAEEEIYNANRELQILNNAILYLVSSQDMNLTLNKVLEIAIEVVGLEGGTICLINPDDTFNLVVERGASQEILEDFTNNKVKIGECLCGNCALDCNPLILDSQDEVLKYATREVLQGDGIRFHAAFPFVADGKSIGVLCVFTRTDTKPTPRSLKLLETIVLQTSIVIDNLRLYDEINNQNVNLEKIVALRTQQLESANKELQTFTYSVSHDLKAPLRGIDGYSNLLMELYSGSLNEEAQYFIHSIRKGTIHMNKLINDLLDYSRLERATLRLEPIKIKELLKMLKTQFESEISATICAFSIKVPDIEIVADVQGLTIALRNLIDNAIKFSGEHKKPVVEISLKNKPTNWLLAIKDNGIGFDMKYKDRIFEIFQQLNLPEDFPGTGIGLAMVQKSMEKLGGKVWAESKLGEGAVFYLEIPKQIK